MKSVYWDGCRADLFVTVVVCVLGGKRKRKSLSKRKAKTDLFFVGSDQRSGRFSFLTGLVSRVWYRDQPGRAD